MLVQTITGVTEKENIEIKKPISHIMVVSDAEFGFGSVEKITTALINSQTSNETSLHADCKIIDLAEITAQLEGLMTANTKLIEICPDELGAAINLDANKYLNIKLTGLVAGNEYKIYGIERGVVTNEYTTFDKAYISADQTTGDFTNTDKEMLALPVVGLTSIRLNMTNGGTATFLLEELKAIQLLENDLVDTTPAYVKESNDNAGTSESWVLHQSPAYGYKNIITVSLKNVMSYEITKSGGAYQFYTVNSDSKA